MTIKNPTFSDTVRVLHIENLKPTYYGNPMRKYTFQRVNTPEQTETLDVFQAKNEPNTYTFCNLRQGDTVQLEYRRRGKSWDFVATNYTASPQDTAR